MTSQMIGWTPRRVRKSLESRPVALLLLALSTGMPEATFGAEIVLDVTTVSDQGANNDNFCSLREAVETVNTGLQVDSCGPGNPGDPLVIGTGDSVVVSLPAGSYALLTQGPDEDLNQTGDLDIREPLVLAGAGPGNTILDGFQLDRILDVYFGIAFAEMVVVRDLSIINGRPPASSKGGCIRSNGNLVLDRVVVSDCEIPAAVGTTFGSGAGLFADGTSIEIRRSAFLDNTCFKGVGGGITFDGGTMNVVASTIARNRALQPTGTTSGGGLANISGTVNILGSAILDNEVEGQGGGLYNVSSGARTMNVMNSTIAGNQSSVSGGGVRSHGDLTLTNVTITENIADADGDGFGDGGGVRLGPVALLIMKSSIVAWNEDHSMPPNNVFPDLGGAVISAGFNVLMSDAGSTGIVDGALDDRVGVDPLLGVRTGSPAYYTLMAGSLAIDRIPRPACTAVSAGTNPMWGVGDIVLVDQRGVGRGPQACEVGAFEDRPPEIFDDDLETGNTSVWSITVP